MEISDIILLVILAPIIVCSVIYGLTSLLGIGGFILKSIIEEYRKLTNKEVDTGDKVFRILRTLGLCYLFYLFISYVITSVSD